MRLATHLALLSVGLLLTSVPASAQSFFFGQDTREGVEYTAVPPDGEAAAARDRFDDAVRNVGLESFEAPDFTEGQTFSTVAVQFDGSGDSDETAATINATLSGSQANQFSIRSPASTGNFGSFPTEGNQFLRSQASTVDVAFDTPISAFGFYGTDIGESNGPVRTSQLFLELTDTMGNTTTETIEITPLQTNGGGSVLFLGFVDQERQYTNVRVSANNDQEVFGFDEFLVADINQATGIAFADMTGFAVEGETFRLLLETTGPVTTTSTIDVVFLPGSATTTGDAGDLGGFVSQTVTLDPGEDIGSVQISLPIDADPDDGETFTFELQNGTGDFASSNGDTFVLTVGDPGPTFSQSLNPDDIDEGETSTYTFTVDNTGRGRTAGDLSFSTTLPTGLTVVNPSNATTTCPGGVVTAPGGGSDISFDNGSVAADMACTVTVDVTATGTGTFTLDPVILDTDRGSDTAAGTTLMVSAPGGGGGGAGGGPALSFDLSQASVNEGAGTYAITFTLSEPLDSPGSVTLSLPSGDPADIGGFTTQTVEVPAGVRSFTVDIPITDDGLQEGNESLTFQISNPQGGFVIDRSLFSLTIIDNDDGSGGGGDAVVTLPPRDADDDGEEDGGPRFLAVPVSGLTAGDIADAVGGDGPAPTVYVLDPETGRLVALDPGDSVDLGQGVYVDVAPGADLRFTGGAADGDVTFQPVDARGTDDRVLVTVGNPSGDPVRISDLDVEGGTLADVILVFDPETGAFEPVSLGSLGDDEDVIVGYGAVIVQVIPDGDADDVSVTLDPDDADGDLDGDALDPNRCETAVDGEVVICVELAEADGDLADRVAVRLFPDGNDVDGQGTALDFFDGLDVTTPDSLQITLPGGVDGDALLAALSTPFAQDSTITIPLGICVNTPGTHTLTLVRALEAFEGQNVEVVLIDRETDQVLQLDDPYEFEVEAGEDLTGRFALVIRPMLPVDAVDRPALADRVGTPFPNPTTGGAALAVEVVTAQPVRVAVYDALGREVAVAFDGEVRPGSAARVVLPTAGLAPGVYIVRVDGQTVHEARRLTVAR